MQDRRSGQGEAQLLELQAAILLLLAVMTGVATAEGDAERKLRPVRNQAELEAVLEKEVTFSFEGTLLKNVLDYLEGVCGAPVRLDRSVTGPDSRIVALQLRKARLRDALFRIPAGERYGWFLEHGVVVVASKERVPRLEPTMIRAYDVRHAFPKTGDVRVVFSEAVADRLVDRIRNATGSVEWKDPHEKTDLPNRAIVVYSHGMLPVRQTDRVHRTIEKWGGAESRGR